MKYSHSQVVFQEVPDEISLALHITGCPWHCRGCHSSDLWDPELGEDLDSTRLHSLLDRHSRYISCVLFLGGDWEEVALIPLLREARARGFKTALYTGRNRRQLSEALVNSLDYLKYGPYIASLGGLDSPRTNQRFIRVGTGELLNHHFLRQQQGVNHHDSSGQCADQ
ncbi:MAG: anaerobic ribonucleoside-triphosphate reductase activating protein [Calothrix sp. SM1_5_4]|nr:anaerobic ribonucleoside-triphosphate reductase activating protein [Calothrix sp. SM1_5_4]